MGNLTEIIDVYLTAEELYTVERALNDLIKLTNEKNCIQLLNYMSQSPNSNQDDLIIYLEGFVSPKFKNLIPFIKKKINKPESLENFNDLQEILKKLES